MILSDKDILTEIKRNRLIIDPFDKDCIQPSSVDLHLGSEFRVFKHLEHSVIDIKKHFKHYTKQVKINKKPYILHPHEFVLGTTLEKVQIPTHLVARLEGKSSLGRLGIIVHATAGYVDPGFRGNLTLEINNVGKIPVTLYPEMRIAQLSLVRLTSKPAFAYGERSGKYQNQEGPVESRIYRDFSKKK